MQQVVPPPAQRTQQAAQKAPAVTAVPVPNTLSEYDALQRRHGVLTDQLESLNDRRTLLQDQRNGMPITARADHDVRIKTIDQLSAQIEKELYAVDASIAAAAGKNFSTNSSQDPTPISGKFFTSDRGGEFVYELRDAADNAARQGAAISIVSVLSLFLVWQGVRRFIWKRKPTAIADQTTRMQQLQQSVDVIALEVERISESQRFLAKVLNDKLEIGAGEARR